MPAFRIEYLQSAPIEQLVVYTILAREAPNGVLACSFRTSRTEECCIAPNFSSAPVAATSCWYPSGKRN